MGSLAGGISGVGKLGLRLRGQPVKALGGSLGGAGLAAALRGVWSGTGHQGEAQLSRALVSRAGLPTLLPATPTWCNKYNFKYGNYMNIWENYKCSKTDQWLPGVSRRQGGMSRWSAG